MKNIMDIRYRSYGENRNLMTALIIVSAGGFLLTECFDKLLKASSDVIIACCSLWLLAITVLLFMMRAKSRCIANDFNVTFKNVLSRDIVINYLDIDEITVYTQMAQVKGQYATYHNIYVEVIIFKTIDGEEYTFKTIMDISPDSKAAALLGMDKIFEMGKFKLLKQFIERKMTALKTSPESF